MALLAGPSAAPRAPRALRACSGTDAGASREPGAMPHQPQAAKGGHIVLHAKPSPRKALELLTPTEAVWQTGILGLAAVAYLFVGFWIWYSAMLSLSIVACLAVATVGGIAAVPAVTREFREDALHSLRAAVASGNTERICEAIRHAQAVGVSEEEAAMSKELRTAIWEKLQIALADGNSTRADAAVRCIRASALCPKDVRPPVSQVRDAGKGQLDRQDPIAGPSAPVPLGVGSYVVGLSGEEVRFAEEVLAQAADGQEQQEVEVIMLYPLEAHESVYIEPCSQGACNPGIDSLAENVCGGPVKEAHQAFASPVKSILQDLHAAIEARDIHCIRAATLRAKAGGVSAEEVAFAEAMLEVEVTRERQIAQKVLRGAVAAGETWRVRAALARAQAVGVGSSELRDAEMWLQAKGASEGQPPSALAGRGERTSGISPKKRVTFAEEVFRIH